ncbi:MAG: hypothetical protein MUQ32_06765, partial [Chloroflexi bacterium]|nr:hypothetical protein [Chloroflexota bacterium]
KKSKGAAKSASGAARSAAGAAKTATGAARSATGAARSASGAAIARIPRRRFRDLSDEMLAVENEGGPPQPPRPET